MIYNNKDNMCPICGGRKEFGTTTVSVDLDFGIVVIRKVRALICQQCGEEWIEDNVAKRIESIVEDARKKQSQIEVIAFS